MAVTSPVVRSVWRIGREAQGVGVVVVTIGLLVGSGVVVGYLALRESIFEGEAAEGNESERVGEGNSTAAVENHREGGKGEVVEVEGETGEKDGASSGDERGPR